MRLIAAVAGLAALAAGMVVAGVALWDTTVPGDLALPDLRAADVVSAASLEEAEDYSTVALWLELGGQLTLLVVLALYARRAAGLERLSAAGPIGTGFLLGMLGLAIVWLAQLPFGVAELWWARRHDLLEIGYVEALLGDWASLAGTFVFLCVALLVAMGLARLAPRTWWLPATAVFVGLTALFSFVSPWLLDVREPRPALRAEAARTAEAEGVPGIPLRIEDVDDLTLTPNAYAIGLGSSRRVVLWNTIARYPRPEVRAVIAHEYAHHARDHLPKQLGWFALLFLPTGLIVAVVTRRRGGMAAARAVPLALFAVAAVQFAAAPLQNAASRQYEAEADWAALNATRDPDGMAALMRHFVTDALADPDPPGWAQTLFASHPTALERIAMADAWARRVHAGP